MAKPAIRPLFNNAMAVGDGYVKCEEAAKDANRVEAEENSAEPDGNSEGKDGLPVRSHEEAGNKVRSNESEINAKKYRPEHNELRSAIRFLRVLCGTKLYRKDGLGNHPERPGCDPNAYHDRMMMKQHVTNPYGSFHLECRLLMMSRIILLDISTRVHLKKFGPREPMAIGFN